MTSTCTLHLPQIAKPGAFFDYLTNYWGTMFGDFGSSNGNFTFFFKYPLSSTDLASFTSAMTSYVDPSSWLQFARVDDAPLFTNPTNSSTLVASHTFIASPRTDDSAVIDSMKTVIEYSTSAVEGFAAFNPNSANTITVQIYDISRAMVIRSTTFSINSILAGWQASAATGATGPVSVFKSLQLYTLRNMLPYDCIWQFQLSVSNPQVFVSLHGLQKIWYYVMTT